MTQELDDIIAARKGHDHDRIECCHAIDRLDIQLREIAGDHVRTLKKIAEARGVTLLTVLRDHVSTSEQHGLIANAAVIERCGT